MDSAPEFNPDQIALFVDLENPAENSLCVWAPVFRNQPGLIGNDEEGMESVALWT